MVFQLNGLVFLDQNYIFIKNCHFLSLESGMSNFFVNNVQNVVIQDSTFKNTYSNKQGGVIINNNKLYLYY